jgi:hypothetical protein
MEARDQFRSGDRVRLSRLGDERCLRMPSRIGTVTKSRHESRLANVVVILFDGMRNTRRLHWTYIERLDPPPRSVDLR